MTLVSSTLVAANTIKGLIANGLLKPNEEIDIDALIGEYKFKRKHVTEAVATLENEGFVTYSSIGIVVRRISEAEIVIWLQKRFSTELDIVRKLAEDFDGNKLEIVESSMREQFESVRTNNVVRFLELNADFHYRLAMLAGFPTAAYWFRLESVRLKISEIKALNTKAKFEECFAEHVAIVEALKRRDPEMARTAMKNHLLKTEERITSK
jgi:DNA-binding GntR family transcriptional regulator